MTNFGKFDFQSLLRMLGVLEREKIEIRRPNRGRKIFNGASLVGDMCFRIHTLILADS